MSSAVASPSNAVSVSDSYRYCRHIARKRAKNFYYSFLLLERPQRDAMCAIYAFMRYCDDLSDDPANSDRAKLFQSITLWRFELDRALAGQPGDNPLWPAFSDSVRRYSIPHRFFHEMIDGITSDLQPQAVETWDDLYRYCYQVASVVGLTIIYVFGFRSVRALLLAEKCGIAFQLTNILRDVREDAEVGRVYLPAEDLERFVVTPEQLRSGREDENFRRLMGFEGARARMYYEESASLESLIQAKIRRSLWALRQISLSLLGRLERAKATVLSKRIYVSSSTKMATLRRTVLV